MASSTVSAIGSALTGAARRRLISSAPEAAASLDVPSNTSVIKVLRRPVESNGPQHVACRVHVIRPVLK